MKEYQRALALYELTLKYSRVPSVSGKQGFLFNPVGAEEASNVMTKFSSNTREPTVLNNKALCLAKLAIPAGLAVPPRVFEGLKNTIFLGNTARCLIEMGQYERALEYLELALQQKPGEPELLSSKGICLDYLGRLDEALVCYNRALRLA